MDITATKAQTVSLALIFRARVAPVGTNHLGVGEDCELPVYGALGDAANTPIYRSGDVSDEQMAAAVANVQSAYYMPCEIAPKIN
ncbi:MAG: hypothetical protein LBK73_00995 [Treponema sp.]|jgi:hypothetical protein|nr:hypothetical protein [Treponema sp.]